MSRPKFSLVLVLLLLIPFTSFAEETISFKGIKFGMKAKELAELGGGNTEYGCASAINDASSLKGDNNQPWTFGGIGSWSAGCMEDYNKEADRVAGVSGLFKLHALVSSHNNGLAKWAGKNTYSVDELVEVFSKVFGNFKVETNIIKNGLGQEFVKKVAIATHKDAVIEIMDNLSGSSHEEYINISITSLDYLKKKDEWEKQKEKKKLNDAKSDF